MNCLRHPNNRLQRQRGVALVVALVLLVIITLLGLSSMRNTTLQERMTANMLDRSLEFQAAETAAREAQDLLPPKVAVPAFPACASGATTCLNECADGLCSTPLATATKADPPRWQSAGFNGWRDATTNLGTLIGDKPPQYFVEDMGDAESWPGCSQESPMNARCLTRRYRIVARSNADDRSVSIIQGSYRP